MFDKTTINQHESKVVAVTQVVEKTITPDKVTEMYDKVRDEVERAIVASIVVDDNALKGAVIQLSRDFNKHTSTVHSRFTLNGQEYYKKVLEADSQVLTGFELLEKLREHFKEVVGETLLKVGANSIFQNWPGLKDKRV